MFNLHAKEKIFSIIIELIFGILLVTIDWSQIANILFIIIGILIILFNIHTLVESIHNLKYKTKVATSQFLSSLLIMLIGILLIFFNYAIAVGVGVLLFIIAIIDLIIAKDHWRYELNFQLPLIIISIFLVIFGLNGVLDIVLSVIGWILIIISSITLISTAIKQFKKRK